MLFSQKLVLPMDLKISKRTYRQRAHTNPFKDIDILIPTNPSSIIWGDYFENGEPPSFLDIGCGYGKFMMELSRRCPSNVLGMEIRSKVYDYVKQKISEESLGNAAIIKTNALIFLPNFFLGNSLSKIFVLFPDPHFKKRKQKGRIVSRQMVHLYFYLLKEGGRMYVSTDVKELFDDMVNVLRGLGLFKELEKEAMVRDPFYEMTYKNTDEAMRAGIKSGRTFATIFEK